MEETTFLTPEVCIVGLLLLAAGVAMVTQRLRFPYTIGLVVVGIVLGFLAHGVNFFQPLGRITLNPWIILYVILPTLVFNAAVNIDRRLLFANLTPMLVLAGPGLIISTMLIGFFLHLAGVLPLGPAYLFGALISATDPVAVISLFKELGAPPRLTLLVDGESLFNDATAIVVFQIIAAIVVAGSAGSIGLFRGLAGFILVFAGGCLVGGVIGYLMVRIIAFARDDHLITVVFSTVAAYSAFIVANYYLKVSGVMSVVGAGIVVSWFGATRFTPEVRKYLKQFWEFAAFLANSFIFLMLGLTEYSLLKELFSLQGLLPGLLVTIAVVTLARAAVVFGLVPCLHRLPGAEPIDARRQAIIFWGGLRGAVPLALALSLPLGFTSRAPILALTLGFVLFTLVVQGTTISHLIKFFHLDRETPVEKAVRYLIGIFASREGLRRLGTIEGSRSFSPELLRDLRSRYTRRTDRIKRQLQLLYRAPEFSARDRRRFPEMVADSLERGAYRSLLERGVIAAPACRRLLFRTTPRNRRVTMASGPEESSPIPSRPRRRPSGGDRFLRPFRRPLKDRIRALGIRYELDLGTVYACDRVLESLDSVKELFRDESRDFGACRESYRLRRDRALRHLEVMRRSFPRSLEGLQKLILYREIRYAELSAVRELADEQGLPEKLQLTVAGDIEEIIRSLREEEKDSSSGSRR